MILMRSPASRMAVFSAALEREGIPCDGGESEDFFAAMEIAVVLSLLEVVDNPRQDVPLIAVLRSPLVGMSADRLAAIRAVQQEGDYYEALRLEASFKAAGERPILCFLHYPPLYQGYRCPELLELIDRYRAERCYYGHLHGPTHRRAFEGRRGETDYALVSADYLGFVPKKICD